MKGKTNNPNGRPKGVPNKVTSNLREWINKFLEDNQEQIKSDWKRLDPRDRITLFEKLLKYSIPVLQATAITTEFDKLSEEDLDKIIDNLKKTAHEKNGQKGKD